MYNNPETECGPVATIPKGSSSIISRMFLEKQWWFGLFELTSSVRDVCKIEKCGLPKRSIRSNYYTTTNGKCRAEVQPEFKPLNHWKPIVFMMPTLSSPVKTTSGATNDDKAGLYVGDLFWHYGDLKMSVIASQITHLTIVYSTVKSNADQRKYQSSASLAFVRGIHRWPVANGIPVVISKYWLQ